MTSIHWLTTINSAYISALLADSSYVDNLSGKTDKDLNDGPQPESRIAFQQNLTDLCKSQAFLSTSLAELLLSPWLTNQAARLSMNLNRTICQGWFTASPTTAWAPNRIE
jgi:hypothetical protein